VQRSLHNNREGRQGTTVAHQVIINIARHHLSRQSSATSSFKANSIFFKANKNNDGKVTGQEGSQITNGNELRNETTVGAKQNTVKANIATSSFKANIIFHLSRRTTRQGHGSRRITNAEGTKRRSLRNKIRSRHHNHIIFHHLSRRNITTSSFKANIIFEGEQGGARWSRVKKDQEGSRTPKATSFKANIIFQGEHHLSRRTSSFKGEHHLSRRTTTARSRVTRQEVHENDEARRQARNRRLSYQHCAQGEQQQELLDTVSSEY
jgi:hypothetical protein